MLRVGMVVLVYQYLCALALEVDATCWKGCPGPHPSWSTAFVGQVTPLFHLEMWCGGVDGWGMLTFVAGVYT